MKQHTRYIFAALFSVAGYCVQSQNFYENYVPHLENDSTKPGTLKVQIYNNNFIKNNEYFGPYTEGITYIGSILQPEVSWILSSNFSLTAGWFFRYYYGQDGFEQSLPVIRARYTFCPGAQVIFGQLDGQLKHGFIEPIYNTDNYYIKNPENGIQLLINRNRMHTDIFMDWEQFLLPGEAHQEVITGGLITSFSLNDIDENKGLSAHLQCIIHHFGGQVDISDNPLQTRGNIATGLKYSFVPDLNVMNRLTMSSFYIQSLELSQTNIIPFESGFGLHNTITAENKWLTLSTGWFHGEYFFAPLGDYLFQSVSQLNNWYVGEKKDLITSKLLFAQQIMKGVSFGFRIESYYDLQRKWNDFSYGLNISVNEKVFERKPKGKTN